MLEVDEERGTKMTLVVFLGVAPFWLTERALDILQPWPTLRGSGASG